MLFVEPDTKRQEESFGNLSFFVSKTLQSLWQERESRNVLTVLLLQITSIMWTANAIYG